MKFVELLIDAARTIENGKCDCCDNTDISVSAYIKGETVVFFCDACEAFWKEVLQ